MSRHIVIVGLGLIGGSMAKALHGFEDFDLIGVDVSEPTLRYALEQDIVDRVEPDPVKALAEGDLVFLCLHPQGIVDFMAQHRDHFKPGAMVTDVCGVKGAILEGAKVLPDTVSFVGGHPMAGTEFSGIQHALVNMFHGAHYILTPNDRSRPEHVELMERLAVHIGCANIVIHRLIGRVVSVAIQVELDDVSSLWKIPSRISWMAHATIGLRVGMTTRVIRQYWTFISSARSPRASRLLPML